jgi:hypothetical protein
MHNRPNFINVDLPQLFEIECSTSVDRFTTKEIKDAVWDLGSGKAPGPDGFNISFIKHF